jgi:hypothetical protein
VFPQITASAYRQKGLLVWNQKPQSLSQSFALLEIFRLRGKSSPKTIRVHRHTSLYFRDRKELKMSGMKSAYELAMERLGGASTELSDEQKAAIADLDAKLKARVAETEIMFDQQIAVESSPARAGLIQLTRQQQIAKFKEEAEVNKEQIRQMK